MHPAPAPPDAYMTWLAGQGRVDGAELAARRRAMRSLPLFSVLMPVFDPEMAYLRRAINSVQGQSWDRWELCIADDASSAPEVREQLEQIALQDPRVRVAYRADNGHICRASNDALALCRGDFVALFDHDDLLHPDALFWAAVAVHTRPDVDVIFTDEDKVDAAGRHHSPHLKHRLNLDILWSQNFVSHLGVFRRTLVEEVGGFRPGLEGSQDHDLVLRVLEKTSPERVVHVPRVLYHWRLAQGSTATAHGAKAYAYRAGRRAVAEHLARSGRPARVDETALGGVYRVRHDPEARLGGVALAMVAGHRPGLDVDAILATLARCRRVDAQVVIQATAGAFERISAAAERPPRHTLMRLDPEHTNVAALCNQAVARAAGDVVVLVAPYLRPRDPAPWMAPSAPPPAPEDWLAELVAHARRPEVGIVGGRLVDCHDRVASAGLLMGCDNIVGCRHKGAHADDVGYMMRAALTQEVSAVSAACMAMRRDVWERLGGMDERFQEAYHDVDLCLRARRLGLKVVLTPWTTLKMSHALEDTQGVWPAGLALLIHKHVRLLDQEPFLSASLRLDQAAAAIVLSRDDGAAEAGARDGVDVVALGDEGPWEEADEPAGAEAARVESVGEKRESAAGWDAPTDNKGDAHAVYGGGADNAPRAPRPPPAGGRELSARDPAAPPPPPVANGATTG